MSQDTQLSSSGLTYGIYPELMPCTSSKHSKNGTKSQFIRLEPHSVVSHCNGTMVPQKQPDMLTSPCLAPSRNASTNSTNPLNACKTHHTLSHHQWLATNCRNYHWQIFLPNLTRWEKTPPANFGLYPLLCSGCKQNCPQCTQHPCMEHCKCKKMHWTMGSSTTWLSCHPSHCNYLLLGKQHGAQSAQQCFLF